ncbi:hypothetical protein EF888_06905 [Silicimonas algicola]|uniref:Bifunctional DNA primase/polymerase-like protein n=1 Tax=Silicimonas algicola TaxID=1826607 RepID=A0A316G4E9_9RHOB|nr:bifunctional DNA primase/polymerase [Silicimonas algicola]AZQ66891.1 hypothetical protein EF888_06905 [Silicimonas algicola]PWK55195.1 bifunctional DNA primase/polymerase-like protein [Silicimonas algicola]
MISYATEDNPFARAGAGAAGELVDIENPIHAVPFDRLPCKRFFGAPPKASLYHTKRAASMRAACRDPLVIPQKYVEEARAALDGVIKRHAADIADVSDHNLFTLAHALAYADHGLHVVDSHAIDPSTGKGTGKSGGNATAKLPRGSEWQKRASTDRDDIIAFWRGEGTYPGTKKHPDGFGYASATAPRNVSIVFSEGEAVWVLDIDGAEGAANLAALEAEHGALPVTPTSISGSGGAHYLFRAKRQLRNTASAVAPKVDVRGQGGQIIAAPSIHESGNFYRWAEGRAPWDVEIAEAPEWLEELAWTASKKNQTKKPKVRAPRQHKPSTGTRAAGFDAIVESIGDGDDREGFDAPINRAAVAWWGRNPNGDADELKELLRDAILDAPCEDDRAEERYATDEYLDERIESARAYAETTREEEECEDEDVAFDMSAPLGRSLDEALVSLDLGFKYVRVPGGGRFLRVQPRGEAPALDLWDTVQLGKWYAHEKFETHSGEWANPVPIFFTQCQRWSDIVFAPYPAQTPRNAYNLFRGFARTPAAGNCEELKRFIKDIICRGDDAIFAWVWLWMAHMVQRPGEKPGTALVIWGKGGAGKGTFGTLLRALVAPYGVQFADPDDIVGRFSGPVHTMNILGVSEEAVFSGDRRISNALKTKVDAKMIKVEVKNVQPIWMKSYMRYVFDSNFADAIMIENNGSDRRYEVLEVSDERRGDKAYFDMLHAMIEGPELEALLYELMSYDPASAGLEWGNVRLAPETDDRRAMWFQSLRPVHRQLVRMIEDGEIVWRDGGETYSFPLNADNETRIPTQLLDAIAAKTGDIRNENEACAAAVFEHVFGEELPRKRTRFEGRVRLTGCEWEKYEGNRWCYRLPKLEHMLEVIAKRRGDPRAADAR